MGRLLNFLLVPLYTSIFAPKNMGFSVLMTVVAFAMVVLTYGFETAFSITQIKKRTRKKCVYRLYLLVTPPPIPCVCSCIRIYCQSFTCSEYPNFIQWLVDFGFRCFNNLPFAKLRVITEPGALHHSLVNIIVTLV